MKFLASLVAALGLGAIATSGTAAAEVNAAAPAAPAASSQSIYSIKVDTMKPASADTTGTLENHKGKVLLLVNVASKCGYTKQYSGLESLYTKYKDKGLVVLGFPCNDFGGQEPGTDAEIRSFCSSRYSVSFPLYGKVRITADKSPLYKYLTEDSAFPGKVSWNFEKFLVGRDGKLIARYKSKVTPESEELVGAIEKALAAK